MYPHFIEVTCELGDDEHRTIEKRLVNVDNIVVVSDNIIDCGKDGTWYTEESYDELKELIRSAGCHIEKGDPRLDQTKPLTKEDIKEMGVGEPVWHSNKMLWGIITNWCDLESGFCCTLVTHKSFIDMDEDDLIKYPIYRMKR